MTIYTRTPQGQAAALNPNSALPRKLRTLLISIDGKTSIETYVSSLSSFGDVASLLESLLNAGLIEASRSPAKPGPAADTKPAGARSRSAAAAPAPVQDSVAEWERTAVMQTPSGFAATRNSETSRAFQRTSPFADDAAAPTRLYAATTYAPAHEPARGALVPNMANYQLKSAIGLMSDFMSTHMPVQSIEIVLELERLSSVEQLLASLKGYESLIGGVGEPARKHLAELRAALSSSV